MLEELWNEISTNLWFLLTLLLTVAIASSFIFSRIGQPKIVGQIVLGIIIGPSVLGIISLGHDQSGELVRNLALLGAIIMLFMIGLECDIREIYTKKNILIAIGGVSVPWIVGFSLAEIMLPASELNVGEYTQSIFVGTALVATSVAITAAVLREMNIIGSKVAKTILGAAVVDDIMAMIVLAIATGTASSEGLDLSNLSTIIIAAVIFVAFGSYLGSHFVTKVITRVEKRGIAHGIEESGFLLALALAFIYAAISELIGISAIVGAFIAGTSFSACEYKLRFRHYASILEWVFAPVFFLSLGIMVNIRLLISPVWLLFAFALAAAAILSKLIGCGIPARLAGMSRNEAFSVGIGMSPRMEVVMIIAVYALTNAFISNEVYSTIVIMGLITVLISPSILRKLLKNIPKTEMEDGIDSSLIRETPKKNYEMR